MCRIADKLTEPHVVRANMRAGRVSKLSERNGVAPGIRAIEMLAATILLSAAPLMRARRLRSAAKALPEWEAVPARRRHLNSPPRRIR